MLLSKMLETIENTEKMATGLSHLLVTLEGFIVWYGKNVTGNQKSKKKEK